MARDLHLAIDLDLTDEHGMLCEDYAEYNPAGVRSLLAALNLRSSGPSPVEPRDTEGQVFDFGIYQATGNRRLACLFGTAD